MSGATSRYSDDGTTLLSATGYTSFVFLQSTTKVYGYGPSDYAFKGSKETLTSFSFVEGSLLQTIGEYSFYQCSALQYVDLSACSKLQSIGEYSFFQCKSVKSIQFPTTNSFTTIKKYAFSETGIKEIYFPASIMYSNDRAFQNCNSLDNITFHPNVKLTTLSGSLFYGTKIIEFTIPASVVAFFSSTFEACYLLNNVFVQVGNSAYVSKDGAIYSADGNSFMFLPCARNGNYSVLPGVKTVEGSSFTFSQISSVTFPEGMEVIGGWAFYTSKVSTLVFPSSLKKIGAHAFYNCKNLIRITIPEGVDEIGGSCFLSCSKLIEVTLPSTLKTLGGAAFSGCDPKIDIKFDSSSSYYLDSQYIIMDKGNISIIQYIGSSTELIICNTIQNIKQRAFNSKQSLQSIRFAEPSSLLCIDAYAFYNCKNLQSFEIPTTVTHIYDSAFLSCSSLKSLKFGSSFVFLDKNAFKSCSRITSAIFSSSSYTINDFAFNLCSSLSSVVLSEGLKGIGFNCFEHCKALKEIIVPLSVTYISDYAFSNCGLIQCTFKNSRITEISKFLFYNSSSLETALIPENVEMIGMYSFALTSIKEVILPSSVKALNQFCFRSCHEMTRVIIPKSSNLSTIGFGVFSDCSSLSIIENECPNFVKENEALYNKEKTKFIVLPANASIKYFSFPTSVRVIGESALYGCKNIQMVFIPVDSVTRIENSAFESCINLRVINIPKCVLTIGLNAFKSCSQLQSSLCIENEDKEYRRLLVEFSLLPMRCLRNNILLCTCQHNQCKSPRFVSAFIFFAVSK